MSCTVAPSCASESPRRRAQDEHRAGPRATASRPPVALMRTESVGASGPCDAAAAAAAASAEAAAAAATATSPSSESTARRPPRPGPWVWSHWSVAGIRAHPPRARVRSSDGRGGPPWAWRLACDHRTAAAAGRHASRCPPRDVRGGSAPSRRRARGARCIAPLRLALAGDGAEPPACAAGGVRVVGFDRARRGGLGRDGIGLFRGRVRVALRALRAPAAPPPNGAGPVNGSQRNFVGRQGESARVRQRRRGGRFDGAREGRGEERERER